MNLKRTLLSGVGGGAVVVWIAAAATSVSRPSPSPSPASTRTVEHSGAALAAEISRLHERLRPTAMPLQARDLFHYAARPSASARTRMYIESAPAAVAAPVAVPMVAPLKLIGIAEDGTGDALVRTAIISGLNDLFLVKQGESVGLRYRVSAISPDTVELIDSSDQSSFRLALP